MWKALEKCRAWKRAMEKRGLTVNIHGKDKDRDIWRGADDKNGEWEISVRVLWKMGWKCKDVEKFGNGKTEKGVDSGVENG